MGNHKISDYDRFAETLWKHEVPIFAQISGIRL